MLGRVCMIYTLYIYYICITTIYMYNTIYNNERLQIVTGALLCLSYSFQAERVQKVQRGVFSLYTYA